MREKIVDKIKNENIKKIENAIKTVKKEEIKTALINKNISAENESDNYKLILGDFRETDIADEIIGLVIIDPPYPAEYLPLYQSLGEFIMRVLKPNGSAIIMLGQSYLPQTLQDLLKSGLKYQWLLSYYTPGMSTKIWARNINANFKPLLWLVKSEYKGKPISSDVCMSQSGDKNFHEWGQSESGMDDIIKKFAEPDITILDPFLGSGTTRIAALKNSCKFIGIEIDKETFKIAKGRMASK